MCTADGAAKGALTSGCGGCRRHRRQGAGGEEASNKCGSKDKHQTSSDDGSHEQVTNPIALAAGDLPLQVLSSAASAAPYSTAPDRGSVTHTDRMGRQRRP
jgi:hypothetical protein